MTYKFEVGDRVVWMREFDGCDPREVRIVYRSQRNGENLYYFADDEYAYEHELVKIDDSKCPYVLQTELEYRFLRAALEKENNAFELARKQHQRRTSELADAITKKFFEMQQAKIDAKRYMQETINERG